MNTHCIITSTSHMQNTTTKKRGVPQKKLFHLTSDKPKLIRNLLIFLMLHIFLFFLFLKKNAKTTTKPKRKRCYERNKNNKKKKKSKIPKKKKLAVGRPIFIFFV